MAISMNRRRRRCCGLVTFEGLRLGTSTPLLQSSHKHFVGLRVGSVLLWENSPFGHQNRGRPERLLNILPCSCSHSLSRRGPIVLRPAVLNFCERLKKPGQRPRKIFNVSAKRASRHCLFTRNSFKCYSRSFRVVLGATIHSLSINLTTQHNIHCLRTSVQYLSVP
jgi:hypothetical protein